MSDPTHEAKPKFLKTIYKIQKAFGSQFGNVSRNFSFGIKPTAAQCAKLETWFDQVNHAKAQLYASIFTHYKEQPSSYLGASFDYGTFFKGSGIFEQIRANGHLITSVPVIEGLRMEINGSIRSFITNHKRLFDANLMDISGITSILSSNRERLGAHVLDDTALMASLRQLDQRSYADIIASYSSLQEYKNYLLSFNELVSTYNYDANQLNTAHRTGLSIIDQLGRLPTFPGVTELQPLVLDDLLTQLIQMSRKPVDTNAVTSFLDKAKSRLERRREGKPTRLQDRLAFHIYKKYGDDLHDRQGAIVTFISALDRELTTLEAHFKRKRYDGVSRNKYFELLAFKATLATPGDALGITTLLSTAKSYFYQGKAQREIITIPGFSWDASVKGKPGKLAAFAFGNKQLYICLASSRAPFLIDREPNDLLYVKTTGGQKKKNSKPKTITYVKGTFLENVQDDLPLLLPLHFGKSYARRYLFNKHWGLFSRTPKLFLNNARLKREKLNPGDPWWYFFDVSISAEKVFGYKAFAYDILSNAQTVIGIDRGEVKPIAYAVYDLRTQRVLKSGFLGSEYIERLIEYDRQKRDYQAKSRTVPRHLRSKIKRIQETLLQTAASQILALIADFKSIVILENLNDRFKGSERSLIPKKTYKTVETLLADSLQLAGLLRIDTNGGYWGGAENSPSWRYLSDVFELRTAME